MKARTSTTLRAIPASARIWSLTLLLAAVAGAIYIVALREQPAPRVEFAIPWPFLAVAVAVAELRVIEVHFRRESHAFSLSEFPAVVGLFFLGANDYLLAMIVFGVTFAMNGINWIDPKQPQNEFIIKILMLEDLAKGFRDNLPFSGRAIHVSCGILSLNFKLRNDLVRIDVRQYSCLTV